MSTVTAVVIAGCNSIETTHEYFCVEYANLVRKVWEDHPTSIAPKELKSKVTRFAPRFGGYK